MPDIDETAPEKAIEAPSETAKENASQAAEHISQAAQKAESVASTTGDDGWKTIASEIKGLRRDIKGLMSGRDVTAVTDSATTTPGDGANGTPAVEVVEEEPPTRKVRRFGRKVSRRG